MKDKQIILITGTSRGIGKHVADYLKSKGHIVYGSSRKPTDSSDPYHLSLDVTDKNACELAIAKIISAQGRLDILVNNAGFHLTGAAQENSLEEVQDQMNLNFYGAVHTIQSVLPIFMKQKSGKIINISSIGGLLSLPYTSAYNASKFALEGYTEALRSELLAVGIYVSNLVPAYVNTGTTDQSVGHPKVSLPIFEKHRMAMHHNMEIESKKGTSMQVLAETIEEIIETKKPKFRYKISALSNFMPVIKSLLPQNYFEKLVLKILKLPIKIKY
jgi:short-subunit dehydrogenase